MHSNILRDVLVPVDFGAITESVIKQAVEFAKVTGANIHLLHIIRSGSDGKSISLSDQDISCDKDINDKNILRMLNQLKQTIYETVPFGMVSIHIMKGIIHDCIIEAASKTAAQLIILGKSKGVHFFKYYRSLCPNEISKVSRCAVLTVMNNQKNSGMQNIVIPVGNFVPRKKIEFLLIFTKIYRIKIHLVASLEKIGERDSERTALLDTYSILKNGLNSQVEYYLLESSDFPKATLKYAEIIGADLILVNPDTETKTSSFLGKYINELVPATSSIKFLFIQPNSEAIRFRYPK